MAIKNFSILISGQRFTSRTETVEDYFVKLCSIVGVIAICGFRHNVKSRFSLYKDKEIIKEFEKNTFHSSRQSLFGLVSVILYGLSFLKNSFLAYRKFSKKFDLFIGVHTMSSVIGILLKKFGKVNKVIYYCIDYYHPTSSFIQKILTFFSIRMDMYCCKNADVIWNLRESYSKERRKNFPNNNFGDKELVVPLTYPNSFLIKHELNEIEKNSVAFVGTLEPEQGWEVMINAVPLVKKNIPNFKLNIFGDGVYKNEIKKLILKAEVENDVIMHGFINDDRILFEKLSKCGAGIAPFLPHKAKYIELDAGKPKLYAFVGLPIIMTHTDFIEKQFDEFKMGRTFKYNSEDLAKTIVNVLESGKTLLELKNAAHNFAKNFTTESMFPKIIDMTEKILKN